MRDWRTTIQRAFEKITQITLIDDAHTKAVVSHVNIPAQESDEPRSEVHSCRLVTDDWKFNPPLRVQVSERGSQLNAVLRPSPHESGK